MLLVIILCFSNISLETSLDDLSFIVSPTLRQKLWHDGFVIVPEVFHRQDIVTYRPYIVNSTKHIISRCLKCTTKDDIHVSQCLGCERIATTPITFPKSFHKAHNLHRIDPHSHTFIHSVRLAKLAADLLQVPKVRLYQSSAFFKEPNDIESSWHQDSIACPLHTDKLITLWIALDDLEPGMGLLKFAKQSHLDSKNLKSHIKNKKKRKHIRKGLKKLSLKHIRLKNRVSRIKHLKNHHIQRFFQIQEPISMKAGDVSAHLGWTLHGSGPNKSNKTRRGLTVMYFADGAVVPEDLLTEKPGAKGIPLFTAEGGPPIVVQLSSDDISTWMPWFLSRKVRPNVPVRHSLCPIVYDNQIPNQKQYMKIKNEL